MRTGIPSKTRTIASSRSNDSPAPSKSYVSLLLLRFLLQSPSRLLRFRLPRESRPSKALTGTASQPTESYDDFGTPDDDPRIDKFAAFHQYLESTFPRVFSTLQVEKVQKYGLLLTWKAEQHGLEKRLKPVVLMAHQDVVPVNPGTVDEWTHPPFSGEIDEEGYVWGRGTADCKNTLIGILAALDKLIEEGFKPERYVLLGQA